MKYYMKYFSPKKLRNFTTLARRQTPLVGTFQTTYSAGEWNAPYPPTCARCHFEWYRVLFKCSGFSACLRPIT